MKLNETVKLINNIIRHPETKPFGSLKQRKKVYKPTFLTAAQALVLDNALRSRYHFPKNLVFADFRTNASKAFIEKLDMFGREMLRNLIRPEELAEFDALYPSGLNEVLHRRKTPFAYPAKYEAYPVAKYTGQLRPCYLYEKFFVSKTDLLRHSFRILSRYKPFQLLEFEDKEHFVELFNYAGYISNEELDDYLDGVIKLEIFISKDIYGLAKKEDLDISRNSLASGNFKVYLLKNGMLSYGFLDKIVTCVPGEKYADVEDMPTYALGTEKSRERRFKMEESVYGTKAYQQKEQREQEARKLAWDSLSEEEKQKRMEAYWSEDYGDDGLPF